MLRAAKPLKGVVIDVDSFQYDSVTKWTELYNICTCCFFTSNDQTKDDIRRCFGNSARIQSYNTFQRFFVPNISTHRESERLLGLATSEIAYVSKNLDYLQNAMGFLSGSVWITDEVSYEDVSKAPDLICRNIESFVGTVTNQLYGYCGERAISPLASNGGTVIPTVLSCDGVEVRFYILGRYFGKKKYMNQLHPYSAALFYNKREGKEYSKAFDGAFATLFCSVVESLMRKKQIDAVCAVPNRPGKTNRYHEILEIINTQCGIENAEMWLRCIRDYPPQKSFNGAEREENVRGAFECTVDVSGKTIVLIDDIVTTGATIKECIRTLLKRGASQIICVVLAVNQNEGAYWSSDTPQIVCKNCGNEMILLPKKNRSFYYFCGGCKQSDSYLDRFRGVIMDIDQKDKMSRC